MTENNIKNLDEDVAVSYGLNVSTTDIVAATSITIKSSPTTTLQSNLGLNNQNNSDEFITITNPKLSGVGKKTATPKGVPATGGVLLKTQNTKNLPNVFFNFKEKTFTNYKDLLFKFGTSHLKDADFIGTKLPTWFGNTDVSSISLTNASNPLSVVKAYGKYFYQLDRTTSILDNSISNTVTLPIKTNPSYTIFVFGVGAQGLGQYYNDRISRVNVLHTFCDSTNPKDYTNNYKNYNIGQIQTKVPGTGTGINNQARYYTSPTASFVGNTLNSAKYAPQGYQNFTNIYDKNFSSTLDEDVAAYASTSYQDYFGQFIKNNRDEQNQKYNRLCYSNLNNRIPYSNFVLNRKTTLNVADNINLSYFSLNFVEMFSYIEGSLSIGTDNYSILRLQTFINGFLTYDGRTLLKKTIPIESSGTFKIKLSNDYISSENNGATYNEYTKLFLFDYIHGISNSSVSTMKQTSRNIVESLLYDYRNIILKSTTDIQLSNSTSALPITSTSFPPALIHPFLKMFFT